MSRKTKTWQAWPDADTAKLKRLIALGWTHRQIAEDMGRSIEAIRSHCRHQGIAKPPRDDIWPEQQMDFLIARYGRYGWSCQRIADEMPGKPRTREAVKIKAGSLGLSDGDHCWSHRIPEEKAKRCLALAMQDYTSTQIADELGVSKAWALRKIHASPYHAKRYKARESMRRSHSLAERHRRNREAAA